MKFIDLTMMPFKPFMPAIACANMNTRVHPDRNTLTTDDERRRQRRLYGSNMLVHVIINRLNELCMHMHIFPLRQKLKQTQTDDGYGMQPCPYQLAGHSVPPIVFFPNHKQILLVGRSVDLLAVLRGTSGCSVVDSWKCQRH